MKAATSVRTTPMSPRRSRKTRRRRPTSRLHQAACLSTTTVMVMVAFFFLLATALIPGCGGSISGSSRPVTADTTTDIHCSHVMKASSSDDSESSSSSSANGVVVICSFPLDAEQIQKAILLTAEHDDTHDTQQQQHHIPTTKTFTQCLSKNSLLRSGDDGSGGEDDDDDDEEEYCIQAEIKVMSKTQLLEQQSSTDIHDEVDDEFVDEVHEDDDVDYESESDVDYDNESDVDVGVGDDDILVEDGTAMEEEEDDNDEEDQNGDDTFVENMDETAADDSGRTSTPDDASSSSASTTTTDHTRKTVGTTVYTLPYSQYGAHVAQVLRRHRSALMSDDDDENDDDESDALRIQKGRSLLKRARWLQKLGLAHRLQLEEGHRSLALLRQQQQDTQPGGASQEATTKQYMQDQVNFSIQAFQSAVQLNQQASMLQSSSSSSSSSDNDNDKHVIHDSLVDGSSPLAIVYFNIGETFALSPNPDQALLARDYLIQSEQLFRRILHNQNARTFSAANKNKGHDMDIVDLQLSWAQCCLRLGVTLLNQSTGLLAYTTADATTSTTTTPDDATSAQQQQQQQQQPLSNTLKSDYILAAAAAASAEGQQIPLPRKFVEMVDRSESFFLQAEQILRRAVELETARRNAADNKNAADYIIKKQQYQQENRRIASRLDADLLPFDAMDRIHPEKHFATALHNLASTALYKSDYAKASKYLEEAWQVYQGALTVLEKPHDYDYIPQTLAWTNYGAVVVEVQLAMGEILYSLADVYLQQGKLRKAMNRYSKAMHWFEHHKIAPPATLTATLGGGGGAGGGVGGDGVEQQLGNFILEDADGNRMGGGVGDDAGAAGLLQGGLAAAVAEHERALEEYNQMFADGLNEAAANAYMDENIQVGDEEYYYARNDGYEGDLHTNLGTMYMAMGDDVQARSHFYQAMQLYSMSGEQRERTMADVKYNMAILEFRLGAYSESSQLYEEALNIFLDLYGEGVNPMLMTLQLDQTTAGSYTAESTTATTKSTAKEKPIESEVKIKNNVVTPKSTTKKYDKGEDKHKIHVDLATFQKQGMKLNETGSDEL